jgi:predicted metal-binding membrane protein
MLWMVMMAAMMTPAALPWLSVLAAMPRVGAAPAGAAGRGGAHVGVGGPDEPYLRAGSLLLGYLTIWGLFSVLAAASQLLLLQLALLEPHTLRLTGRAAGGVLLLAGLWELSPIKDACLRRCRSPFGVLLASWAPGPASGYRIGLRHGLTCLACCWGLMALSFVAGVVNLGWMAVLTAVVCAEKVMPGGPSLPRFLGVALACAGVALLAWPG